MLKNPETLADCLDVVKDVRSTIARELANIPETGAHQEVHNLFVEIDRLSPDLLKHQQETEALLKANRAKTEETLAKAKAKLASGRDLLEGKVPQAEIDAMWKARLGEGIITPPIPDIPTGWSNLLERELQAKTQPVVVTVLNPLESNAWNDWAEPS